MANYGEQFNSICFGLHRKYRSEIEIMALILDAVKHTGDGRYNLMKQTGSNFTQLKKHLQTLIKLGFIEVGMREGKMLYKASDEGLAFLNQFNILRDMLLSAYTKTRAPSIVREEFNIAKVRQGP